MGQSTSSQETKVQLPDDIAPLPGDHAALKAAISGKLVFPGDPEYLELRKTWNHDTMSFPSAILQPARIEDVQKALVFVDSLYPEHKLDLCIAGGRHGTVCMTKDSLVIDMRRFDHVSVLPEEHLVKFGSGCLLGQVDAACEPHLLAFPAGHNPTTGVAGLILGGGIGYLSPQHGMAIDCLQEIEIVLLDGKVVRCNATNYPDLFWALRGGGGNFGVVTEFVMNVFPVPREVYAGEAVWLPFPLLPFPRDVAKRVLSYLENASRNVSGQMAFVCGGPLAISLCHFGELEKARAEVDSAVSSFGWTPINTMKPMSYFSGTQRLAVGPKNDRQGPGFYFIRALILTSFTEEMIDILWEETHKSNPNNTSVLAVQTIGGKTNEASPEETAISNRNFKYWMLILGNWSKPSERSAVIEWVNRVNKRLLPFVSSDYGAVALGEVDHLGGEGKPGRRLYDDQAWEKLRKVKTKYDPQNIFHKNYNIPPL